MRHTLRQGGEGLQFSQPHNSHRGQRLRALRPAPHGRHQPPQLPRPLRRRRRRPADPGRAPPQQLRGRPLRHRLSSRLRHRRHPVRLLGRPRRAQDRDRRWRDDLEPRHSPHGLLPELRPALPQSRRRRHRRGQLLPRRHVPHVRLFPQRTARWGAGSTIGIAIGYAGGGYIADKLGWRAAFFIAGVPGLIFAFLAFQMREPLRGAVERAGPALAKTAEASLRKFLDLLKIPTLRATIIAQTLLFFVLASNAFWLPTVLQRRFEMTAGRAGLLAGVVIVVGGLIGTLAGGWLADRRALATPKAHLEVGIIGFLAGAVLITVAILSPLNIGPIPVFIPVFLLTVICLYLYAGPFTAVSQNVVSPGLRASAVTLLLFVAHVFGDSHSTFDIGLLSDRLGGNLQLALLITSPTLLILAAIAAATGLRTIKRDTEAMEEDWAARTGDPALTRA